MTLLSQRRKDAIKIHEAKTKTIVRELEEVSQAMRVVGLERGAEKIERIVSSIQHDLKTLMTSASVR
jgi:hypothetical protein